MDHIYPLFRKKTDQNGGEAHPAWGVENETKNVAHKNTKENSEKA
jgi:hypothetical protein